MRKIDGKDDKSVQSVSEFEHFYQSMEGCDRWLLKEDRSKDSTGQNCCQNVVDWCDH